MKTPRWSEGCSIAWECINRHLARVVRRRRAHFQPAGNCWVLGLHGVLQANKSLLCPSAFYRRLFNTDTRQRQNRKVFRKQAVRSPDR